jgi:hypothetical protein
MGNSLLNNFLLSNLLLRNTPLRNSLLLDSPLNISDTPIQKGCVLSLFHGRSPQ